MDFRGNSSVVEHNLAKVGVAGSTPVSRSIARVAELVDARDLKSLGIFYRAGSSPASGTTILFFGVYVPLVYVCDNAF